MLKRYNNKLNMSLSPLGFGVMRLPMNPDGTFPSAVHALLREAYERGINFFDTAFPYLGGHSEELIRDALVKNYPRENFYIADKLPVWDCSSREGMERIFNIQLERLGVEYIDFYLLHHLNRFRWPEMYKLGVLDFLKEKRREGRIRKIGFSMHDDRQTLETIVEAYDWDLALLQINYYDWTAQNAKTNYELLEQRDIPCMVMEPVGGGRLARLPEKAEAVLTKERPSSSSASWAMRFAAGLSNVFVTLSGMSNKEQLDDNLQCFSPLEALSKHEHFLLDEVVGMLRSQNTIPCTGCNYCVDECPANIDIPKIMQQYNDYKQFSNSTRFDVAYFIFIPESRRADKCIDCKKCNEHCPQNIDIPKEITILHDLAIGLSVGVDKSN